MDVGGLADGDALSVVFVEELSILQEERKTEQISTTKNRTIKMMLSQFTSANIKKIC